MKDLKIIEIYESFNTIEETIEEEEKEIPFTNFEEIDEIDNLFEEYGEDKILYFIGEYLVRHTMFIFKEDNDIESNIFVNHYFGINYFKYAKLAKILIQNNKEIREIIDARKINVPSALAIILAESRKQHKEEIKKRLSN